MRLIVYSGLGGLPFSSYPMIAEKQQRQIGIVGGDIESWRFSSINNAPAYGGHDLVGRLTGLWHRSGWNIAQSSMDCVVIPTFSVGEMVYIARASDSERTKLIYSPAGPSCVGIDRIFRIDSINPITGALNLEQMIPSVGCRQENISPFTVAKRYIYSTLITPKQDPSMKVKDEKLIEEGKRLIMEMESGAQSMKETLEEEEDYPEEEEEEEFMTDDIEDMIKAAECKQAETTKRNPIKTSGTISGGSPFIITLDSETLSGIKDQDSLPRYAREENKVESNYRARAARPLRSRGKKMF